MDFPLADLMDQDACSDKLVGWLHPDGLTCPRCGARDGRVVHHRHRAPILDYRCASCGRVFNAFTGTALQATKRRPVELVLILRGFAQGVSTARLARELGCDRTELLALRHRLQHLAWRFRDQSRLDDPVVEADAMYQSAGEKRRAATDPRDPPRRRGNNAPGHGTWESDRPPVCGVVGRESGRVRLSVEEHADSATLNRVVREAVEPPAVANTDDWRGYDRMAETGCSRAVVCHAAGEWARDDDGDGVREVHNNTQEGLWTGLRNFLGTFGGVNKAYLDQDVAIFEWGHNIKRVTPEFIRAMLGVPITTFCPP